MLTNQVKQHLAPAVFLKRKAELLWGWDTPCGRGGWGGVCPPVSLESPKSLPVSSEDLSPPATHLALPSKPYQILGDTDAQLTNCLLPSPAGVLLDLRPALGTGGGG